MNRHPRNRDRMTCDLKDILEIYMEFIKFVTIIIKFRFETLICLSKQQTETFAKSPLLKVSDH